MIAYPFVMLLRITKDIGRRSRTNVALVSNVVVNQCGDLASELELVVDSHVPVAFVPWGLA